MRSTRRACSRRGIRRDPFPFPWQTTSRTSGPPALGKHACTHTHTHTHFHAASSRLLRRRAFPQRPIERVFQPVQPRGVGGGCVLRLVVLVRTPLAQSPDHSREHDAARSRGRKAQHRAKACVRGLHATHATALDHVAGSTAHDARVHCWHRDDGVGVVSDRVWCACARVCMCGRDLFRKGSTGENFFSMP